MKKRILFILMCVMSFCSCKINDQEVEHTIEMTPISPHNPTTEITFEKRIESTQKSILGLTNAYNKLNNWIESNPEFTEGIDKATNFKKTYGKRIEEIKSLQPDSLTEEELIDLSIEISELVSNIREINDMFEFH